MSTRRCLISLTIALLSATSASAGIAGRILSSEGEPLAGATVVAYAPETADERAARLVAGTVRPPVAAARVDASGSFRLDGTPAVVDVVVQASGFAPEFETLADAQSVTFALRRAPTVRGVVLSKGRPVVGATVVWTADAAFFSSPGIVVRSGSDGSYEVPDPEVWATGLVVTHPDFTPLEASLGPVGLRPAPSHQHELDPGVAIAGRVVEEASARAVEGATIVVDGWPLARSSHDGSFVVRHAAPAWARLVARADGLIGGADAARGQLLVPMRPARRFTGSVYDAESGAPIAGALVGVYDDRSADVSTAVTDAHGRYAFASLAAARYRAWSARPGYAGPRFDPGDPGPIDLRRDASVERDLQLAPLQPLAGYVQDELGRPIAGAVVRPWTRDRPNVYAIDRKRGVAWPTAWTAPDGTFVLTLEEDAWTGGSAPVLLALKRGYAASRLELEPPGAGPHVITLTLGVDLTGRVTTPDGEPISGVSIALAERGRFGDTHPSFRSDALQEGWAESDAEGRFVTRVNAVAHHVAFRKSGLVPKVVRGHHPVAGQPLDVVLEPAAEIRGRILRNDGTGIPDVQVYVMGARTMLPALATTTSDGRFLIGDLSPSTYELHFSKAGTGLNGSRTVAAPDTDLQIRVGPAGTIRGMVTDAWTHAPIGRLSVEMEPSASALSYGFVGHSGASIEAPGGTFTIEEVPVGEATLTVRAEGFVPQRLERVVVSSGVGVPVLEITLDRGAQIQGFVTAEDGAPMSDADVSAEGQDGELLSAVTDELGAYDLQGVFPGSVKLQFRRQGYITMRRAVEATGTTRADAVLARGLVVSGVVLADGVAIPEASVWAHSSLVNAERVSTSTDEEGRFALEGLSPGRYNIEAHTPEGGEAEVKDLDVESAGWLRLSVQRSETAVLSGWVSGLPETDDVGMVTVRARGEGGESEYAFVDETGWFRMEKAPSGAVMVRAVATSPEGAERSTRAQELSLPPGSETEIVLEFTDGLVVAGRVTREGAPVAGVTVSFRAVDASGLEASARTDADGRYEVVGLEPRPYRVSAWGRNTSHSTDYTVTGHDHLDIDVTGAALSGVVLDAASGSPLADLAVSLWRLGPGEQTPDESMTTNADGEFAVRSLQEGRYRVLASMQGFGQELLEVDLRRGHTAEVVLELEPSEGLTLEVVDARDGQPLNATVVVRDTARRIVANRHSRLRNDGSLNIALAPGRYLLSTSADGYGTVTRRVVAPANGLRVGLTPGGTLVLESDRALAGRIRLVGADGEEYVRCWCNGLADIDLEGRRTTVENVTPGTYNLQVVEQGGVLASAQTIAIREGQTSRVRIE